MFIRSLTVMLLAFAVASFNNVTQADTLFFNLEGNAGFGLLPGNENPGASGSGSGGILSQITFDTITKTLSIDVGWGSGNGFSDLTGNAVAMHIHGPADFGSNAGVQFPLDSMAGYNSDAASGGFTGSLLVDATNETRLLNDLLYINVHTAANPGGELRGNLVFAIPEPASSSMLVIGLAVMIGWRRRR